MEVEWLILSDAAEVTGNKLYLLGGGWDRLTVNSKFPLRQNMAIALSIRVPWNETNQKHSLQVEIVTADGESVFQFGGQVEVGRPPGIPPGQDQRMQAVVSVGLTLQHPGTYEIIARVENQEMRRTHFNVVAGPMLQREAGGTGQPG